MKSFGAAAAAVSAAALFSAAALACDSCYGPASRVEHVRLAKRIQPGAPEATYGPTRPLEWGQINFMHTSDTHGWLEGHLKEENYGADFGDFVSFSKHMKQQAKKMGVDLLLVDTGDLHDGTGFSDSTSLDGALSNPIFEDLDYDLLTIGNHELYVAEVTNDTFINFSKYWGEKYLTSNVQFYNPATSDWDYIGKKYRYFTTEHGLRVMAFGVLFDFKGNANNSKVIPAETMVQQAWFTEVINNPKKPVDLFVLIGHNIPRPTTSGSTFPVVHEAIRAVHPDTPIQIFGGHSHIRDFAVVDQASTALESGRYCETVGWLSMSGFSSKSHAAKNPRGVPNPARKATANSTAPFEYARRYLDWNRYTFKYHSVEAEKGHSHKHGKNVTFDTKAGLATSAEIEAIRTEQRLGKVYGCVPKFYCQTCVPFGNETNIFTVLSAAMAEVVVNPNRTDKARMILANTGSVRFDMHKGPFTYDDNFIVSPFRDIFLYVPDVPYADAQDLLAKLNAGGADKKKRSSSLASISVDTIFGRDAGCVDPVVGLVRRDGHNHGAHSNDHGIVRRQVQETSGYTTTDDFGTDGDDTEHVKVPSYEIPEYFGAEASYPASGKQPEKVDVVFFDFIEDYVLSYLGSAYTASMVNYYVSSNFSAQDYLLPYVEKNWKTSNGSCAL